jgi:hypothetical protein
VFPTDNIWNTPIDQLPRSGLTSTYVNTVGATYPLRYDFGSGTWQGAPIGVPYTLVPGTQTKYPATFYYPSESDPGPYAIPLNAPIQGGSEATGDRHVVAIDTDNCILYEFWRGFPEAASWRAGTGAIFNLRSNALRPSGWTSANAAGMAHFAGLVRYEEIVAGEIRHALNITVPQTRNTFIWPARHFASSLTGSQYPPMGTRFRLRANFDISGFSPVNQVILRAMKRYGMMVSDNGAHWWLGGVPDPRWNNDDLRNLRKVTGADFEVVDVSGLMIDRNSGQARQDTVVSVTMSPRSATVLTAASKQFTAAVVNSATQTVNWSVNGAPGGNSVVGWISTSGFYTAPAAVPAGGMVTVQATSTVSPAAVANAVITVKPAPLPPVLNELSPARGARGTPVRVTLTGSNFAGGATVAISGTGVTISNVAILSKLQIRAVFTIAATAATGPRSVTVKTAAGTSNAQTFTVQLPAPPTLTSITPSYSTRNATVAVTLKGTNFAGPASLVVSGSNVTASDVLVTSSTAITAKLYVSSAAVPGARTIAVKTPAGVSNTAVFTIR